MLILKFRQKNRELPYEVRKILSADEGYTVYYEKLRIAEGVLLCTAGLYFVSRIYSSPIVTFNGSYIWCLIIGFLFLSMGLPLCFGASGGCVLITDRRVIIYRTRCFAPKTLDAVYADSIQRACRISAGRKGTVHAFWVSVSAFFKGEREKALQMKDAAFLNGYIQVFSETDAYKIRLREKDADNALSDIGELCGKSEKKGKNISIKYPFFTLLVCPVIALAAVVVFGITLTSQAKASVEKQYVKAVYLEGTEAYSQAYVEYAHLAELYDYKDCSLRSRICYAQLELSQGRYREAAKQIKRLPDFEKKNELLYLCGLSVEQENSASLAAEIYALLGDYKDCSQRLELIEQAYNEAIALFDKGEHENAALGFSLLRDYKQTGDYVAKLAKEADKLVPNRGNPENLSGREILKRCEKALPLLEILSWDSECASIKALCEEYISIYKFD